MLRSIFRMFRARAQRNLVGQHIIVQPTDLVCPKAAEALRRAVARSHTADDLPWVLHDLRSAHYPSHVLNSISGRHQRGTPDRHPLVVINRDISVQGTIDAGRARDAGVTIVMTARTPSDYALVNSMLFSRVTDHFPLRARRIRTGKFRIFAPEPPDPLRPTKTGPAPRRRMTRGDIIHDLGH